MVSINWESVINFVLLIMLVVITIGIVRVRNLFAVVMLGGIFSLLMAIVFDLLEAVDVAFTEAAIGAGVATILALAALSLINNRNEKIPDKVRWSPLLVASVVCVALLWAVEDLPRIGDPTSPVNLHVGPDYIARTPLEIDVPNIVTAVLASYRGFDTLGELTVIFTAGIGVIYLLTMSPTPSRRRRDNGRDKGDDVA